MKKKRYEHLLNEKISRREALSTAGKVAIGVVAAGVVAGLGGYFASLAARPPTTVTKTIIQTRSTVRTVTKPVTVVTPATPTRKGLIGQSWHVQFMSWHVIAGDAGEWFASCLGYETRRMNARRDPAVQINQAKMLIEMERVDALIFAASDMVACCKIAEMAHEAGIPCFTVDEDVINCPYVDLFVGWDEVGTSSKLAEKAVDFLKEKYGKPKGLVYVLTGALFETCGVNRWTGTKNVLDKYPDIKYFYADTKWSASKARELLADMIKEHGVPDAVINCGCGGMSPGIFAALDEAGLTAPRDDPKHVCVVAMDAGPYNLDMMRKGRLDYIAEQPVLFYVPLAVYWADKVLTEGKDALPKPGQTFTEKDIDIAKLSGYRKFYGVNPWKYPIWAPAKVIDDPKKKHLWFQTRGYIVEPKDVDNPALYGNMINAMKGYLKK